MVEVASCSAVRCSDFPSCAIVGTKRRSGQQRPRELDVPVLALGGERSFGATVATVMRFAASEVEEGVVPDSGHWIMEENPKATIALVRTFLDKG
jgi:pimeloyl-ACP methyl ester carboxylesterase